MRFMTEAQLRQELSEVWRRVDAEAVRRVDAEAVRTAEPEPKQRWRAWYGGRGCSPVTPNTRVVVLLRNGEVRPPQLAELLRWTHYSEKLGSDIIAYYEVGQEVTNG